MNKEELLNLVESLNMPRDEYYILGGGSLVMFGIKDKTADLDLCVSEELFARLKEEYNLDEKDKNDLKLSVKIVYDKKIAEEKYSGKSEGELYQILWEKVKEINKTFPPYKYIKNMILTDEELIKTTTQKVKRNEEIKRILGR